MREIVYGGLLGSLIFENSHILHTHAHLSYVLLVKYKVELVGP